MGKSKYDKTEGKVVSKAVTFTGEDRRKMKKAYERFKIKYRYRDSCEGVRIDPYPIMWSVYKKMPFTYNAKWNRVTLPVAKGRIDKEWLNTMSDLDYFISNPIHVDEVINKSNWYKDGWW